MIMLALLISAETAGGLVGFPLFLEPASAINSAPVILQNGTAGTSTIYMNSTSSMTSVEAPLFDFVDNNDPNVDSSSDKGMHSNFPAQQAGPDSTYDALTEENTEAIEDYVDNNTSDEDSSPDIGTHTNFENQKAIDLSYDTLTEASQANTYSLDATGGYMIIGDGTPDWGSTTGTISFWVKMDTSVQGRFYGQNGDMETRWSGANLILDWGGTGSMTSAFSFSADTWYFIAIVWDENNNNLFLYVGDENNAPTLDSNSLSGTWTGTTPAPTQNRFMNGVGANEPMDGHGDDLRYWNVARSLLDLQSDYNATLTGSESNLRSYFKLDSDFDDIGPNDDDGSGSGSYSFSTDVPFSGSSNYDLDIEVQFTNIIYFLPTEKLYIYMGALGSEDLRVDYWNGTGWENLATDLAAYSCNYYTVSLTSTTFTIRFRDEITDGDATQDQWQIDASLLRIEGLGSNEDAVDNDTSNVDGSADVGTLSNFDSMKTKDGMATLTEGTSGGQTVWLWQEDTSGYTATSSFETYQFWSSWTTNSTTSGTITKIGIYVFANPQNSPQVRLGIYADSGGVPNNLLGQTNAATITGSGWLDLDIIGGGVSISASTTYHIAHITNIAPTTQWRYYKTATPVSRYRNNRVWPNLFSPAGTTTASGSYRYGAYRVGYVIPYYRLDQEVQWTSIPHLLPNEMLCIYGGTMGSEDIKVDIWNGTGWEAVFGDLSAGWNNASVTDWLTTSILTIRFTGGNEIGDTNQDTWQIDVALIHFWYDGAESYELNLEVQWTSAEYSRTYEVLCIKTGTFSGSENIQVRAWNTTGSSWQWIMNLTASQWNNISITSYLTSSTFTIQFLGGTETSDTVQDSWNIDATLLHIWNNEPNWLIGWNNRAKITIDHNDVDSDLSDFPVLVYLSNSSGRNNDDTTSIFDEVGTNGKKIAVTQSDGTTQCYVEIEKWDNVSEQAWLWVKIPSISNTADTELYLYYDNSQPDNSVHIGDKESTPAQSVWNTNFKGVWHLDEDPSGTAPQMKESTLNNNNGTSYGNMTPSDQVAGKIDGSLDFDGTDDYIQTMSSELKTLENFTLSVWFKADSTTTPQHILWQGPVSQNGWGDGSGNPNSHEMHLTICKFDTNNTLNFFYGYEEAGGDWIPAVEINISFSDTTNWNHAVVVMTGAGTSPSAELFLNGVSQGTDTGTQTNRTAWDTNLRIGRPGTSGRYFDGMIDEVRILGTACNASWVKASYESERDDLFDFGTSETSEGTYEYVLRAYNTVTDSWQIRLKKFADSNISRLQNCTIYFSNSTDTESTQIIVEDGSFNQTEGPWFDLGSLETIYIIMTAKAGSIGISYVYAYLEVLTPGSTTYAQYAITFKIT